MVWGRGRAVMKRTNEINESPRGEDSKRQRSLSASYAEPDNNTDWLLANQQRMQMLAQSDALAAVAAAGGHQQLNLLFDDYSNRGGMDGGVGVSPTPRVVALENAHTQLAAAMIRQRQAEDTLRQCQQQQAVAVAEYLQQQAANLQQQSSQNQHLPQGSSTTSTTNSNAAAAGPLVPQAFNIDSTFVQGIYEQRPGSGANAAISTMSRNNAGMFGTGERVVYRIPVEFANSSESIPNRNRHANNKVAAAAAAAAFGSPMDTYNSANSIIPGYSSFLLSSTPAPLNSHLAPTVQSFSSDTSSSLKQNPPSSPNPRKKSTSTASPTTPKISIAGPKRRPVSLQSLVNRGEACYDPGPVRELALPSDRGNLSEYQCLLRKQIVLFSVSINDIQCSAQGRNKPIVIGQVGVLCRHCARIPPGMRPCGAAYFPGKLSGLYQVCIWPIYFVVVVSLTLTFHHCSGCTKYGD